MHLKWLSHGFSEAVRVSRGELDTVRAVEVTAVGPGSLTPVLWSDTGIFVDASVRDRLERNRVSGWRAIPAAIATANGLKGGYCLLVVLGRCKSISYDKNRSDSLVRLAVKNQVHLYRRISLDLEGWDGLDIFVDSDGTTGFVGLSELASSVFREAKGARPVESSEAMMFESVE
jgi:hypothetical protein